MDKYFKKSEAQSIKRILGKGYGKQIQEYLLKQNITNSKEEPFSIEYIYQIVNGQKSNRSVQEQILNLVEEKLTENDLLNQKRSALLR